MKAIRMFTLLTVDPPAPAEPSAVMRAVHLMHTTGGAAFPLPQSWFLWLAPVDTSLLRIATAGCVLMPLLTRKSTTVYVQRLRSAITSAHWAAVSIMWAWRLSHFGVAQLHAGHFVHGWQYVFAGGLCGAVGLGAVTGRFRHIPANQLVSAAAAIHSIGESVHMVALAALVVNKHDHAAAIALAVLSLLVFAHGTNRLSESTKLPRLDFTQTTLRAAGEVLGRTLFYFA